MLTRRHFLELCAGGCLAGLGPGLAFDRQPKRSFSPVISGTLWWCSPGQNQSWGRVGWRKELAEQQKLGFDLLWLTQAPAIISHETFALRQLLDLCEEMHFQVIVDTGFTPNWYAPLDLQKELELGRRSIAAIGEKLAGHPAFYAWYIPHEIYMDWGAMHEYVSRLYPALVELCKKAAALPVTLSPFFILDRTKAFGDFRFAEADEYRDYWSRLIRNSGLDIIMLQDSGEHFSYVRDEQRKPFFQAMSQACRAGGAKLWGNVEVAEMECASIEEYVRRFGRVHHSAAKGISWRPVPMDRLRTKLSLAAEYSERIVSWGYQQFCRPEMGGKAAEWYESYRAYYKETTRPAGAPAKKL